MEEIGHRTTIVSFRGIAGQQRPYIDWLLINVSPTVLSSATHHRGSS
jgi:hypothetical protein